MALTGIDPAVLRKSYPPRVSGAKGFFLPSSGIGGLDSARVRCERRANPKTSSYLLDTSVSIG